MDHLMLFLAQAAEEGVAVGMAKYLAGPTGMLAIGLAILRWLLEDRKTRVPREAHAELRERLAASETRLASAESKRDELQENLLDAIRGLED